MSDLNDLSRPVTTDTEPNVLDTLRAHIIRAATWSAWNSTVNKVAGIMSATTAAVTGGRSLRLYRRNDANTGDEEIISLPGISVGGNAGTASAAQSGSALEMALAAKAPLNNPALTGTPTAPTAAAGTNTQQIANTAFVATAIANLVASSPSALDTLNELAGALGNDANFASTVNTALANRVSKTGDETVAGIKTFSSVVRLADGGFKFNSDGAQDTGVEWVSDGVFRVVCNGVSIGQFSGSGWSGNAGRAYPKRSDGGDLNFYWSGQSGQPTWLWGGSDGSNMYVYNPSNFNVNYANSAGSSASCSGNAATATALSTASGSAPSYAARAWVNFNGTGTVAIRGSGNVSSITDNGVGDYSINLSTALPDANFSTVVNGAAMPNNLWDNRFFSGDYTTNTSSKANIVIYNGSGRYDNASISVNIFR
jgi:hypothetical protein